MSLLASRVRELSNSLVRFKKTAEILEYWNDAFSSLGDGEVPKFNPEDVASILPYVYLLQKHGDRLRYRVSGEEVNRLFNSSHIGKYLDEVVPEEIYPEVAPYFLEVFEKRLCIFKGHVLLPSREHMEFERVLLPIERRGEIQLLGTLALSTSSGLREDVVVPEKENDGFHFTILDLTNGKVRTHRNQLVPLSERYAPRFMANC